MVLKIAFLMLVFFLPLGCHTPSSEDASGEVAQVADSKQEGMRRETTIGPVRAEVELSQAHPVLGEQIELRLRVEALPDVAVMMPEFGDQLGRFGIANYRSSEGVDALGQNVYEQVYTLDLPMSGTLRTPSFLVEFTDNRANSEKKGEIQELLTEEMSFEVASVFESGSVPEAMAPPHGALPELILPDAHRTTWWWYAGIVLVGCLLAGAYWRKRHGKLVPELPPDRVAFAALDALSKRGMPKDPASADRWYVELSSIVRRYVERRFGLDAPRLTTEEFFEQANRSTFLEPEAKQLIRQLLERSDRVKFTDFMPSADETAQMLSDARRFVEETRESETKEAENA